MKAALQFFDSACSLALLGGRSRIVSACSHALHSPLRVYEVSLSEQFPTKDTLELFDSACFLALLGSRSGIVCERLIPCAPFSLCALMRCSWRSSFRRVVAGRSSQTRHPR
mmetsp:Transcript_40319/g.111040  ORF Transcript_40319/g.111040 Transcript_40319/m.111040 type:complete len:111 (-) Transcript_40319:8-340(-)